MSKPEVGRNAPAFTLPASSGRHVKLSDFAGSPVVVYFYPKDDTPGCTMEAREFQALAADFEKAGVSVLGISPDSVDSHCKFAEKHGLAFTLLADEKHDVAEKYGVWVEKNMYGKKYWGVQRSTFLIDRNGAIAKMWPRVKPQGHAEEVLKAAREL
ncbi:MAG TPA: thioredoxin-dependent thiol peroxidase [Candidatus Hydrogenedentes bacterium]|jgi:peroxiredoxin Q/BCP|nr:thioredoxin-dependent thiol peroxidase [Candidatus Hydrogenedentota bacterium]HPJ99116.1 thioredoxin-dependent thiol peroxidase [Candidatus Hydrogenedentota bacterium]